MDLDGPALAPPEGNGVAIGVLSSCTVVATICCFLRGYARVYVLIFGICYSLALPAFKIAILIEWCRLFAPIGSRLKSPFWVGCVTIIFVQTTANIAIIVALNLQCIPHKAIYDFRITGNCFDLYKLQVGSASIHLICDVVIFLLPQRTIWTLKMSWRKRLGVYHFRTSCPRRSADLVYTLGPLAFWAMAEMTCGFFIICLPSIPMLINETGIVQHVKKFSKGSDRQPYAGTYELGTESFASGNRGVRAKREGESTERLRDGARGLAITRTMQFMLEEYPHEKPISFLEETI
ncbi:hypothetical protein BJX63DRAFT_419123 [Aspergillus granulosus]|uniref:Rhodopsin domain-containing protein n=1 Tax=Aspergillus granulosus TaxID=176169 RepID=A0ABR4HSY1_9EURO